MMLYGCYFVVQKQRVFLILPCLFETVFTDRHGLRCLLLEDEEKKNKLM
jgi:hypothetical protein